MSEKTATPRKTSTSATLSFCIEVLGVLFGVCVMPSCCMLGLMFNPLRNHVSEEEEKQLRLGMTKPQVLSVLGSPVGKDADGSARCQHPECHWSYDRWGSDNLHLFFDENERLIDLSY